MKKTILVVDDSEFDRNLLAKVLVRKFDCNTLQAADGEACLKLVTSEKIDLVLLDIMMPGIFGTQVLMKIRESFSPLDLPVIMVTARADASDVVACLQVGANDYITKPINFEVAASRISNHLILADLAHESARLKELEALHTMVMTYGHEINTPLTVALFCLEKDLRDGSLQDLNRLRDAIHRIVDIMKDIRRISAKKEYEYEMHADQIKIVKVK